MLVFTGNLVPVEQFHLQPFLLFSNNVIEHSVLDLNIAALAVCKPDERRALRFHFTSNFSDCGTEIGVACVVVARCNYVYVNIVSAVTNDSVKSTEL